MKNNLNPTEDQLDNLLYPVPRVGKYKPGYLQCTYSTLATEVVSKVRKASRFRMYRM